MQTPGYDALNTLQRLAVRHAVFKQYTLKELTQEACMLERALETVATDPDLLKNAVAQYERQAKRNSQRIALER